MIRVYRALVFAIFAGAVTALAPANTTHVPYVHYPMLGTHNSATGYLSAGLVNDWAITQTVSLSQQLALGARSLNLRPAVDDSGQLVSRHGPVLIRVPFSSFLSEISLWCRDNPLELVTIHISKCEGRDCWVRTRALLGAAGIPVFDGCVPDTVSVADVWAGAQLPRGGAAVVVEPHCVEENYDPRVECTGISTSTSAVTPSSAFDSAPLSPHSGGGARGGVGALSVAAARTRAVFSAAAGGVSALVRRVVGHRDTPSPSPAPAPAPASVPRPADAPHHASSRDSLSLRAAPLSSTTTAAAASAGALTPGSEVDMRSFLSRSPSNSPSFPSRASASFVATPLRTVSQPSLSRSASGPAPGPALPFTAALSGPRGRVMHTAAVAADADPNLRPGPTVTMLPPSPVERSRLHSITHAVLTSSWDDGISPFDSPSASLEPSPGAGDGGSGGREPRQVTRRELEEVLTAAVEAGRLERAAEAGDGSGANAGGRREVSALDLGLTIGEGGGAGAGTFPSPSPSIITPSDSSTTDDELSDDDPGANAVRSRFGEFCCYDTSERSRAVPWTRLDFYFGSVAGRTVPLLTANPAAAAAAAAAGVTEGTGTSRRMSTSGYRWVHPAQRRAGALAAAAATNAASAAPTPRDGSSRAEEDADESSSPTTLAAVAIATAVASRSPAPPLALSPAPPSARPSSGTRGPPLATRTGNADSLVPGLTNVRTSAAASAGGWGARLTHSLPVGWCDRFYPYSSPAGNVRVSMVSAPARPGPSGDSDDGSTGSGSGGMWEGWEPAALPLSSRRLSLMQAHWQYSTTSVVLGALRGSSVVKDQRRSRINKEVAARIQKETDAASASLSGRRSSDTSLPRAGSLRHLRLFEVDDIADGGPLLAEAVRKRVELLQREGEKALGPLPKPPQRLLANREI